VKGATRKLVQLLRMSTTRHQELAESLLMQITDGTYSVGDQLPTEMQLSESTGLARGTVRRALGHLEKLGMISRLRGEGTVVLGTAPVARYQPVAQSAVDIANLAADTKLLNPEIGEVVADEALATRIGMEPGTSLIVAKGARIYRAGDAQPLCWSEHYLRSDASRSEFLRGVFTAEDVRRTEVEQTIHADLLDGDVAAALDAEEGEAALVITRYASNKAGHLVSVGIHTHPGKRYRITTTL
jgi:GntR family transcriptional regulator